MAGKGYKWRKGTDFKKYNNAPYWDKKEKQMVSTRRVVLKAPGEPVLDGQVVPWAEDNLPDIDDVLFIGDNVGDRGYRVEDIIREDHKITIVFDTTKYLPMPEGGQAVDDKEKPKENTNERQAEPR